MESSQLSGAADRLGPRWLPLNEPAPDAGQAGTNNPLHALVAGGSEDDTLLLPRDLHRDGFDPARTRVETADAMHAALRDTTWEMIIRDGTPPKLGAPAAPRLVKQAGLDHPSIVVTSMIGEEKAVEPMTAGAHDVPPKDNLGRPAPAVEREISDAQVCRERSEADKAVRYQAQYDLLTGLPNRSLFLERLNSAIGAARRNRRMLTVLLIDLDRFKVVNDALGHAAGDKVIKAVTGRLTATLPEDVTVARMGADQFIALLPSVKKAEDAVVVIQRIFAALEPHIRISGHELHLAASIGASLYPRDGTDAETLLKNADAALHKAKERGGACHRFFTREMDVAVSERLSLEGKLRNALKLDQLVVHYQPVVDATTTEITGAEALVRWKQPDGRLVLPAKFISLAEETGLIGPLGEWVLRTACAQARAWQGMGLPSISMAVNLSAGQFKGASFLETVNRVLDETGLDPFRLKLELTESMIMDNMAEVVALLRELHEAGIGFAIDDFGTGYSSLSHLQRFPIDTLKIDRIFVRDMALNPKNAAMVHAIISMAHSLNLKTIAEGVETEEQLIFLRAYRCDGIQGYLYSRPLPANRFARLLASACSPKADDVMAPPSASTGSGRRRNGQVFRTGKKEPNVPFPIEPAARKVKSMAISGFHGQAE